ncbi:MAG: iron ABC transporter permease, partial [Deltaproteobacteria bacterium]
MVALGAAILISLVCGTAKISFVDVFRVFSDSSHVRESTKLIVLRIRLPRVILAGLAGFTLSLGGLVFQALLRNPLADPFVLGVSSGAAFGAVIAIILGFSFGYGVPLFAFLGAIITIYLVLAISKRAMGV